MTPELADLTPALEIIVGVLALLKGNDLGEISEQQGECTPYSYDANRHIVLVQHENVAV